MTPLTLSTADLRTANRLLAELQRLLAPGPCDLQPGDVDLASELLPAWWSAFGSAATTVAELRQAHDGTRLAQVLERVDERVGGRRHRANQLLGTTLARLAGSGRAVAGHTIQRIGTEGKVSLWVCSPLGDPADPASE